MRSLNRFQHAACLALLLLPPTLSGAAESAKATEANTATSRFKLKSSGTETAPQQSGRYTLRARFALAESAGELREGANFTLIGRFAKAGLNCATSGNLFANGFEGN